MSNLAIKLFTFLCAFVLSIVGIVANAAIIYRADFESEINTSSTNPVNSGTIKRLNDACVLQDPQSYTYGTDQHVRRIQNVVRAGSYALTQIVQKGCDYRSSNPDGRQKPRVGFIPKKTVITLNDGSEYWVAFSFQIPTDHQTETNALNPDNLFQLFKEDHRNPAAHAFGVDVVQDEVQLTAWNTGASALTKVSYDFEFTKGIWYDYVLHVVLDSNLNGVDSGEFQIYLDYEGNPNDPQTPILTGTGYNTQASEHSLAFNLYKYAGYCTTAYQLNASQCPYSVATGYPAGTTNSTAWGPEGAHRQFYFDEIRVGNSSSSLAEVAPHFDNTAPPTPATSIIGMNAGQPLSPNADPVYFTTTGGDTKGVVDLPTVSDGTNTATALGVNSNATGGRYTLGSMSNLNGGPVTVSVAYDNTMQLDTETQLMTDAPGTWTVFNVSTPAAIDSSTSALLLENYGATKGASICNSSTGAGYINSPTFSVTSGQQVVVGLLAKRTGTQDLRLQYYDGTNVSDARGTLGSGGTFDRVLSNAGTTTLTRNQVASDVDYIRFAVTANSTGNHRIRLGPLSNGNSYCAKVLGAKVWVNPSATTLTYTTSATQPDTQDPSPSNCQLGSITTTSASLGCDLDDNTGTFYAVITDSATAPSLAQCKAGHDHTSSAAVWSSSQAATSGTFTASNLDPYTDKYAYFCQTDAAANDSAVVAAETSIPAETPPVLTKTLRWGAANNNTVYCYDPVFGTLEPFNGQMNVLITAADLITAFDATSPDKLVYASNVTFTEGEAAITEADVDPNSGSINALSTGDQGYNFWIKNSDDTCRADGEIQVVEE